MSNDQQKPEVEQTSSMPPYKYCLNCNTELNGNYCHNCGQQATNPKPSTSSFIIEYLSNAFMWDTKLFSTLWYLISQPGRLTSDFLRGHFIAHTHPLKLNMFMLFVTITIFVFLSGTSDINDTVQDMASDKQSGAVIQIGLLDNDTDYMAKMNASPRDTVELLAPLSLATSHPHIFTNLETLIDTKGEGLDRWRATIPHILIEDEVITADENNCYSFNTEAEVTTSKMTMMLDIFNQLTGFISKYFPLLVLLTTPLLAMSLNIIHRNRRLPGINHFIFSLHYTTFLAVLMIFIYVLYMTILSSIDALKWIVILGSTAYLAIALRRVYDSATWLRAIIKAMLVNVTYLITCIIVFSIAFIIACISVAWTMV